MEILIKDITDIVVTEVKTINNKVKGLNFLETLKVNVIEKCLPLITELKFPLDKSFDFEKKIEENMFISLKYFTKSMSIRKKSIIYDTFFVSFNETSILDIRKNDKKYTSIVLYKNNGLSLPRDSIVNFSYNKNVLFLELQNKNIEQSLIK